MKSINQCVFLSTTSILNTQYAKGYLGTVETKNYRGTQNFKEFKTMAIKDSN